jgi:hypothetical protein
LDQRCIAFGLPSRANCAVFVTGGSSAKFHSKCAGRGVAALANHGD